MKKLVTIALLCAMLLSCFAGLGIGVQASTLDGENPNVASGEDVVAIGYQIKQNDNQTYDLRLVLGMKDGVFEGVGVEVDILFPEGEKSNAIYVKSVYKSVKDNEGNVYAASTYGCDYLYVVVISGVPAAYTIANKQLQLTVTPFGANKVENEIVVKNGSKYTVGKYADLWDGETADISWFDKNNIQSSYTLDTAEEFAGYFKLRQDGYNKEGVFKGNSSRYYFDGVSFTLTTDVILNDATVEEMKANGGNAVTALNSKASFKGTFDGQGHTIYGVYLSCTSTGIKALFGGFGDNSVLTNLNIDGAYFGGTTTATEDKSCGAILAARANGKNVLISNITISNVLLEERTKVFSGVGLLIGRVDAGMSLTLENCHTSGNISFPTKGTNNDAFGGIVGYMMAGSESKGTTTRLVIKNCTSSANIRATNIIGGLVGKTSDRCDLTIYEDCKFTGTLETTAVAEGKTEYKGEYVAGVEGFQLTPLPVNAYTHQDPTALADGADMRVMSFNILCELWNDKAVIAPRVNPVLAPIYTYMPDILGMQEVSDGWYAALAPFFDSNDSVYSIVDKKTDRGVTNFSPLVYNTETMTLLEHGVETFSVGDERLRVLSWGYFERKSDGERFIAINTHWNVGDANDEKKTADQVTQATEMAEFVLAMKAKYNCPIITTGDYNNRHEPGNEEVPLGTYIQLSGMKDSRLSAKVANRSYKTTHTLFTECHRWDGAAIDHIFVSSDVEVLFYNILIDDYQRNASDHNPIYADIKLK